ncbi:hypothetical protein F5Y16DRAFT_306952 [Xylariaceae sp. FL0255]|nr:hypothetical protein F5Y16DRAFT_306952 [Xylariaceae sp. FL0255]
MARMTNDDIDAITPCPVESSTSSSPSSTTALPPINKDVRTTRSVSPSSSSVCSSSSLATRRSRNQRRESIKVLEEETGGDPERLWRRMLALQRQYGCYNSARMSAALSSGDVSLLRPSKACLDLLNEHMAAIADADETESENETAC